MVWKSRMVQGTCIIAIAIGYCSLLISGSMTTDQAKATAKKIWGESGFARHVGRNYQVGCGSEHVVAMSKLTFDDAFSHVNMKVNGLHMITATVRSDTGETADSPPVPVILCN